SVAPMPPPLAPLGKPAVVAEEAPPAPAPVPEIPEKSEPRSLPLRWSLAAAVLLLLLGGVSLTEATGVTNLRAPVIRIFTPDGTLVVETDDPGVKVTIEGDGGLVITGAGAQEVRVRPGSYKVRAVKDGKPVKIDRDLVTISRGDKQIVRVRIEGNPPAGPRSQDWPV